jgi:hypothetical protein
MKKAERRDLEQLLNVVGGQEMLRGLGEIYTEQAAFFRKKYPNDPASIRTAELLDREAAALFKLGDWVTG